MYVNQENLEQYLSGQGILEDGIRKLKQICMYREKQKGDTILEMGERSDYICYIMSGIVRGVYYSADGEETTKCFSKEGQWCCMYNMISEQPSAYRIEALEDCILVYFPIPFVKKFMKERLDAQKMYATLYQQAFVAEQERSVGFQTKSATERYLALKEEYQDILNRVDQRYIASYLGVTPSSLSRIRRGLKE